MRLGYRLALITGLFCVFNFTSAAFAFAPQRWQTVDQPGPGRVSGMASSSSSIFAAGFFSENGFSSWVIRKSGNDGNSWTTVDEISQPGSVSSATGVAVAPDGSIYAVGNEGVAGVFSWIVRKSGDGGATWRTVDQFVNGAASDVSVAGNGDVYVVGNGGNNLLSWVVRRSLDGGTTWTTVDTFSGSASTVVTNETGAVFVGGTSGASSARQWTIRYSADGLNWSTVDTYPTLTANKAARWNDRVVFAGGQGRWVVRGASFSNPSTWTTLDDFLPSGSTAAEADGVTVTGGGEVYVSGHLQGKPAPNLAAGDYWLTRRASLLEIFSHFTNSDVLLYPNNACGTGFLAGPDHTGSAIDSREQPLVGRYFAVTGTPNVCDWTVRRGP